VVAIRKIKNGPEFSALKQSPSMIVSGTGQALKAFSLWQMELAELLIFENVGRPFFAPEK
jgi:hypothetical protein